MKTVTNVLLRGVLATGLLAVLPCLAALHFVMMWVTFHPTIYGGVWTYTAISAVVLVYGVWGGLGLRSTRRFFRGVMTGALSLLAIGCANALFFQGATGVLYAVYAIVGGFASIFLLFILWWRPVEAGRDMICAWRRISSRRLLGNPETCHA